MNSAFAAWDRSRVEYISFHFVLVEKPHLKDGERGETKKREAFRTVFPKKDTNKNTLVTNITTIHGKLSCYDILWGGLWQPTMQYNAYSCNKCIYIDRRCNT